MPIVSGLREYAEALEAGGSPRPYSTYQRPDGQWVADVFPLGLEAILFGGCKGEVWIQPGAEPTQGQSYRTAEAAAAAGGVALVLGAGNQTSVAALDVLHMLVVCGQVVALKMNPVNEVMGPFLRRAFQPLVDAGFVEVVYGGSEVGATLCKHPLVRGIHLTGSSSTYDAIVWQGRPKSGTPPLHKAVSAELGCATPYIVVPGPWSDSDMEYHAEAVATGMTHNAGHNCLKAEVIVTDAEWPMRDRFLAAVRSKLAATPNRVAYYPGSGHKAGAFKHRFPDAEEIGAVGTTVGVDGELLAAPAGARHADVRLLPWLLKTGLTPDQAATQHENWCGVLQEVALPGCGGDASRFLRSAVEYANDKCWGTLSCAMFVHPATQAAHAAEFDEAVAGLRYGSITINAPGIVGFALTKLAWGAYAAAGTPEDIGSGNCFVHNTMLFDHVQKSVLRCPWRFNPHPFWLVSHRNAEQVGRRSLSFLASLSPLKILPLAAAALKG